MRHLFDNLKVNQSLIPATYTADKPYSDGAVTAVDTQGYQDGLLVATAGDIDLASGDETYAIKLFECDTSGGTYTDTGISVTITADNTVGLARIAGLNVVRKRYLKATLDVGGTTPSFPGTALIVLGAGVSGAVNND